MSLTSKSVALFFLIGVFALLLVAGSSMPASAARSRGSVPAKALEKHQPTQEGPFGRYPALIGPPPFHVQDPTAHYYGGYTENAKYSALKGYFYCRALGKQLAYIDITGHPRCKG